jgi:hypothetical protein
MRPRAHTSAAGRRAEGCRAWLQGGVSGLYVPGASCAAVRCAWGARCSTRIVAWSRTTAMPNMRILRFGTGRQRMVLERGTNPRLSRRPCACEYGATIVSRGIGGRRETAPSELISTSSRFFPVGDVGNGGGGLGEQHTHTHTQHTRTHTHTHAHARTAGTWRSSQPIHPVAAPTVAAPWVAAVSAALAASAAIDAHRAAAAAAATATAAAAHTQRM